MRNSTWLMVTAAVALGGAAWAQDAKDRPARPNADRGARADAPRPPEMRGDDFDQMMRRFGEAYKQGQTEQAREIARGIRARFGREGAPAAAPGRPAADAARPRGDRGEAPAVRPPERPGPGAAGQPDAMRERIRNAMRDAWQQGDREKMRDIMRRAQELRQRMGARPWQGGANRAAPWMQRGGMPGAGPGWMRPQQGPGTRWGQGMGFGPRPPMSPPGSSRFGGPQSRGPGGFDRPAGPPPDRRNAPRGPEMRGGCPGCEGCPNCGRRDAAPRRPDAVRPPIPDRGRPGRGPGRA